MGKAEDSFSEELRVLSPNTRIIYRRLVKRFMVRFGVDGLEDLFSLQWESRRSDDPRDLNWAESRCRRLMFEMVDGDFELWPSSILPTRRNVLENGYSGVSALLVYDALDCFYRSQNVPFKLGRRDKPRVSKSGRRILLDAGFHVMWDCVGFEKHRNRAWMMFDKDNGLRVSDVLGFDVEDVLEAKEYTIGGEIYLELGRIITQKTKTPAYPVLGPEAVEAVRRYIGDRRDGPLFLDRDGKRWSVPAASTCIGDIAVRAGLENVGCHSFRIRFETKLQGAGVSEFIFKRWMGKAIKAQDNPYSQTYNIPGEMVRLYAMNYDALRVFREKQEVEELRRELDDTREDYGDMEQRVRDMERYIEQQRMEQAIREELDRRKR